ncbi:apolipoprotein D-like [Melanotaenia boesemani]|uniref:apolipoprotein D-like n=1 Tax=Melanotaenia boesemani TaxID=1250792 RepID=UPI001C043DFE|nr:apolipoprotein D-like [Melanotaenia boesemani]XP_041823408.1 apolipoprotein D-like [Melanotaenia boesemani]
MSAACLLLLLLPLISAQTFNWGPCPNPQVQPNFNLQQYLGQWYEIEKLPAYFSTGTCIKANYSLRADGTIRVLNSQVINGEVEDIEGTAVIQDIREPSKLGVSFSYFTPYSPYWVLKSDYTSMSVVYSCTDILRLFHIDYAWILARSRSLPPETVKDAKQLLISEGINISRMKPSDQSCSDD